MNLAPNGKPSNLTPEQYKLVRTPAFKKWFGDWENSPETASKVVDSNGEPLVVYHGTTNKNINIFRPLSYFTENYSYAKVYGLGLQYSDEMDDEEYDEIINRGEENVYSVFLNIVNPLKADRDFFTDNFEGSTKVKISKIDGYDGMINTIPKTYSPFYKENENQFLIFNSNQIKLADGTNTTFDSNNPDIRFDDGGNVNDILNEIKEAYERGSNYYEDIINDEEFKIRMNKNHPRNWSRNDDSNIHNLSLVNVKIPSAVGTRVVYNKVQKQVDNIIDWDDAESEIKEFFYEISEYEKFYDGGGIKITSDKLHDRTEDTYSIGKSYADVTKGNNSWSIDYIESRSKGDGSKLINKIIDDAKKQNVSHINLQTGNGSETFFMKFGFQVTSEDNGYFYKKWSNPDIRFSGGGTTKRKISQTPAPKKDRIYGSSKNKPKSSESKSKASSIILNPTVLKSINTILKEHNEDFPKKKIPLSTAKAVVRRGMGAFSSSYRPTISGGKPNSRVAWGLARLKAFVYKIQKGYSKSGKYKQDNDLIEELGYKYKEYKNGGEMELDNLYKEHHEVWAKSEEIIKNVCEENCSKYSTEIYNLYETDLKAHFVEEEQVFFPSVINENNKDLIKELIKEHHLIKFLAQKIKLSKKTKDIKDFCNLIIEHIKKEESIMKTISNDPYKNTAFRNGGLTMKAPSQINKMPSFIAPNGNTSNLISIKAEDENGRWVYLYDIVRTPAFKNWFGDWEEAYATKDYEGVSKIIDENGEPSVCYHATSNEFFEFDENYIGSKTDSGYYGKGFYFTEGTYDSHYGEREIPCFLNIMNPLSYKSINRTNVLDTNELKEKGYDGVLVFPNYVDVESIDLTKGLGYHGNNIQEIVAYYPEQIKLADATNRTFNKYDSDIRYKNGGNIPKFNIESREGEEDRTTISLKGIGEIVLVETFPEYEFTEDIDEDTLNDLGLSEGDMIGKIEHIEIKDEYKGKGYAKLLMKKAIELAKQKGLMPLYLNASPMGSKRYGLSLEDLTDFYESFGFKVFLNQGNNNLMILKEEDVKFNEGGNIPMKEEYKYFLVLKLGKPVFKVKFSKYNKETERDMSDMLDKLNDMDYSLKSITQQEYKDFDYSKVNKEDILEFTKNWTYLKNGGVVEKSNKIEFRRNRLPRNDIYEFAKMVKSKYPKVWDKGGNIFGNEAFVNLERVLKRGYWLPNEEWMQIKWQSYIARHHKDFRIEGVVAMLKWIGTVDKGWAYMKKLINEEIEKKYPQVDEQYKNGGQLGGKCPVGTEVQSLLFSKDEFSMEDAKEWAKSHGYKYDYVDEKENTFRIRQENPSKFVKDIFRTIEFKKGLKAIVACPKS
jgi:N-acetylglutamate synthase-like GNAT family acetyltransferase